MATRRLDWFDYWSRTRGGVRPRPLRVEELERRENPAVVLGTPLNDIITVQDRGDGSVDVTVESFLDAAYTTSVGSTTQTVAAADGLMIDAGLGDDTVKMVGDVPLSAITQITGGAGNDRVGVFAPLAQPVAFAGGDGSDVVELFGLFSPPFDPQNPFQVQPHNNNFFSANPRSVARQDSRAVSFDSSTEAAVVHGSNAIDVLTASAGLIVPVTFDGVNDTDELHLDGTAGNDVFFLSDAGVSRQGDQAVFLPVGTATQSRFYRVFVTGGDGDDQLSAAPALAAQRPEASRYFFDGGAGFDSAYVNGTADADAFFVVANGIDRNGQTAIFLTAVEAATVYGYGGNDTLTFQPGSYRAGTLPVFGFSGGDGADVFQVGGTIGVTLNIIGYTFSPTAASSPIFGTFYLDSVETQQSA